MQVCGHCKKIHIRKGKVDIFLRFAFFFLMYAFIPMCGGEAVP